MVDEKEAVYNASLGAYVATVENNISKHEVFIVAKDTYTTVEYAGETGIGTLNKTVYLLDVKGYQETIINVTSESGATREHKLILVNKSDNVKLDNLWVNGIELEPIDETGIMYAIDVKKLASTINVTAKPNHPYATVQIGDLPEGIGQTTGRVPLEQSIDSITIPVRVKGTDGNTVQVYNIVVTRLSDNTRITKVEVNNVEVSADDKENYEITLNADTEDSNVNVLVMPEDRRAKVSMGDEQKEGTLTKEFELDVTAKETVIPIKVIAQDETEKTKLLTIKWLGRFTGKVKTQVLEGIPEKALVVAYKAEDEGQEINKEDIINGITPEDTEEITYRKIVQKVETNDDGTFELNLTPGEYELVILKKYYLDYRKVGLSIDGGETIDLGEHQIYAGDVNEDGQIEVKDLTALTYNYGEVTAENGLDIYDINQDGIVNLADRNILRNNYYKKAQRAVWTISREDLRNRKIRRNIPLTEDDMGDELAYYIKSNGLFKFPLELAEGETYRITSPYGLRKHPTTGVESNHTGIDIVATWHADIYAVADGEVVFAGNNGAFGNSIEIKHIIDGQEIYTFYAHLSQIDVNVGDTVEQGQVIGLEGGDASDDNPGTSTGHHLHFEVRSQSGYGNDVNPNYYINF